jgi:hypothetical protein
MDEYNEYDYSRSACIKLSTAYDFAVGDLVDDISGLLPEGFDELNPDGLDTDDFIRQFTNGEIEIATSHTANCGSVSAFIEVILATAQDIDETRFDIAVRHVDRLADILFREIEELGWIILNDLELEQA